MLAERRPGSHLNLALNHVVASVIEAPNQYTVHEELLTLLDRVGNVFAIRWVRRRFGGDIEGGVGKTVVEVVAQDGLTVVGKVLLRVRLTGAGV